MSSKRKKNSSSRANKKVVEANKPAKQAPIDPLPLPVWLWVFKHVSLKAEWHIEILPWYLNENLPKYLQQTQGILTTATTVGVVYFRNIHSIYFVANILSTSFFGESERRAVIVVY
jgi:hypothetical protein